jgi:hypothetical protein
MLKFSCTTVQRNITSNNYYYLESVEVKSSFSAILEIVEAHALNPPYLPR